jgi:hypothetical protein
MSDQVGLATELRTALNFDPSNGLLQVSNSSNQMASLGFRTSSLGSRGFHVASDGNNGVFITVG